MNIIKITPTGEKHKEAKYANPFINLEVDKIKLKNLVMQEYEAVYTSENELKGMQRINVSKYNIKNNFNLKIYTNEIFMQKKENGQYLQILINQKLLLKLENIM